MNHTVVVELPDDQSSIRSQSLVEGKQRRREERSSDISLYRNVPDSDTLSPGGQDLWVGCPRGAVSVILGTWPSTSQRSSICNEPNCAFNIARYDKSGSPCTSMSTYAKQRKNARYLKNRSLKLASRPSITCSCMVQQLTLIHLKRTERTCALPFQQESLDRSSRNALSTTL